MIGERYPEAKKYLVDANDFTEILASDYKNVSNENAHIIIEYENGKKDVISNNTFAPTKSLVLKNNIKIDILISVNFYM